MNMGTLPPTPLPPPAYAPSTSNFGAQLPPEPPVWPKVIGIIAIVWGSIGLGCGLCGASQVAITLVAQPRSGATFQSAPSSPAAFISVLLGVLISILLLIAGVMLVRRQPIARSMFLIYGVLSILSNIMGLVISLTIAIPDMLAQMKSQSETITDPQMQLQTKQMLQMLEAFMPISIIVSTAIGMLWPLFCLVWFGLVKRRSGDMGHERDAI